MQLRLPQDKLERLKELLGALMGKRAIMKRELQSLVGLLEHASAVVQPGHVFMRQLHCALAGKVGDFRPTHFVQLNGAMRADILWWHVFVEQWNGIALLWALPGGPVPDLKVLSDASGRWGCGAHWLPRWLIMEWTPILQDASIQVK